MQSTTCLQYCIKGMGKPLFEFTTTKEAMKYIEVFKKIKFNRDAQIKELLIVYNSYHMVQGAIQLRGLPKSQESVLRFMLSEDFDELHNEIVKTVEMNYPMLMSCLTRKDKRKLHTLFK